MMKIFNVRAILFLGILFFIGELFGQTVHTSYTGGIQVELFPQDKQICERAWNENYSNVIVKGKVQASSNYDKISLWVTAEDGASYEKVEASLTYAGGTATFELQYQLPATFIEHEFILYGINGAVESLEWKVDKVVAGDIYLINGQSNAQAYLSPMPEDVVSYTRGYKDGNWGDLTKSFPGRWGAHLAKVMAEHLEYPVGIFNFADGALPISYFQKNLQDSTLGNYGRMLDLFKEAGVQPSAAFWFHGEANGWDTPLADYKMALDTLHKSWKKSFGIHSSFLFQVRHKGCAHPNPDIYEAQRRFAEEQSDVYIMSTTNADQDSCHYRWEEGYRALSDRMALVLRSAIYGEDIEPKNFAPNVAKIELFNPTTLYITFKPDSIPLTVIGDPSFDFRHEEKDQRANSVFAIQDTLVVQFEEAMEIGEHFTYLSHPGPTPDWVVTETGVGVLEFYNQVIEKYIPVPVDTIVDTVAINNINNINLSIFPNPIDNACTINWKNSGQVEVQIVNAVGATILRKNLYSDGKIHLEIPDLPKGIYNILVHSNDHFGIGKLVKL